jgi:5'-3' exonuclease
MLQLLDLAGIYFRAFFAVPTSMTSPDGRPVNAVRGSLDILARVITDARPTRVVACLDLDWRPAWRVALIPSYKTHRVLDTAAPAMDVELAAAPHSGTAGASADIEVVPDELSPQVPILLDVLAAIGIATAGAPGFEADDVIGTLTATEQRDPVEVVTGDRDLFQVARDTDPRITVRYIGAGMSKAQVYGAAEVAAKYGIPAGSYADFAALRGDPSDGLPGVPGVGDKTAATLINRFGSVEGLLEAIDGRSTGLTAAMRAKLSAARDYLDVAPQVVRVAVDAPISLDGTDLLPSEPVDPGRLSELIRLHGIGGSTARLVAAIEGR